MLRIQLRATGSLKIVVNVKIRFLNAKSCSHSPSTHSHDSQKKGGESHDWKLWRGKICFLFLGGVIFKKNLSSKRNKSTVLSWVGPACQRAIKGLRVNLNRGPTLTFRMHPHFFFQRKKKTWNCIFLRLTARAIIQAFYLKPALPLEEYGLWC